MSVLHKNDLVQTMPEGIVYRYERDGSFEMSAIDGWQRSMVRPQASSLVGDLCV